MTKQKEIQVVKTVSKKKVEDHLNDKILKVVESELCPVCNSKMKVRIANGVYDNLETKKKYNGKYIQYYCIGKCKHDEEEGWHTIKSDALSLRIR